MGRKPPTTSDRIKDSIHNEIFSRINATFGDIPTEEKIFPDLPVAKNIIQWVTQPQFLNMPTLWQYPQQFQIVRDFFELFCPYCNPPSARDCAGQDEVDLASQVLLENGVCPKCGITKLQLQERGDIRFYNELVGAAGRRGGKSVILGGFIATYNLHRAVSLKKPLWDYFGLIPNQQVEVTFIAAAALQAKDTIWETFKGAFKHSPWFKRFISHLKNLERKTLGVHVGDYFDMSETRIDFKVCRLVCVALNSNSGSAVGRTNLFIALDELAKFDHTESKRSADEVYESMKKGLKTIQAKADLRRIGGDPDPLDAIMGSISSPMWTDDKIMRLVKTADQAQRMFAFHKSTYDMNPTITRESTADDYIKDEVGALRDYDAIPPDAYNPFIRNTEVIDNAYVVDAVPILHYEDVFVEINGFPYVYPRLINCINDKMTKRAIVLDAGARRDSFGMSIGHARTTGEIVSDAIVEVRPSTDKNLGGAREVHFESVLKFIYDLSKYIYLEIVVFDRWQSIAHIQRLRDSGYNVLEFNVGYSAYENFRNELNWGRILLLPPEKGSETIDPFLVRGFPIAKAYKELKKLQDIQGRRIEKSPGSSDDLIQCVVGCHRILTASDRELTEWIGRQQGKRGHFQKASAQKRKIKGLVTRFTR